MKKWELSFLLCLLILFFSYSAYVVYAGDPVSDSTWGTSYEADPAGSDSLNKGDDWIRELKSDIRKRAAVEHDWGNLSGSPTTDYGRHLEGSAVAFYADPCPSTLSRGDFQHGGAANTDLGEGRICRDSATGELKINSSATGAASWVQALTALSGTIELLNTPRFANGTAGDDPYNPLAFTIRNILIDTTTDATSCAAGSAPSTTAIASQAFGEAGIACFSVTLDLSSRVYATSRVLVLAQYSAAPNGAAVCGNSGGATQISWTVYRDSTANQIGALARPKQNQTANDLASSPMTIAYITTLSNASHEFALHVEAQDTDCRHAADTVSGNFLAVIDLGPAY